MRKFSRGMPDIIFLIREAVGFKPTASSHIRIFRFRNRTKDSSNRKNPVTWQLPTVPFCPLSASFRLLN